MRRRIYGNKRPRSRLKKSLDKLVHRRKTIGQPDYFLFGTVLFLVLFGLVMLSSASGVEAFRRFDNAYYYAGRQLLNGALPGLIIFFIFSRLDYQKLERFSVPFFVISLILLSLVFIPGVGASYGRAQSWINIAGFSFQPAEVVKLLLILSLSGWFAYRGPEATASFWNGLAPLVVILAMVSLPIILQPDVGTLAVVVTIALGLYYVAGAKLNHLAGVVFSGIGAFSLLIIQAPYRAARLTSFLNPELQPSGIGYHINQAFLAVGSGGLFGLGFGQSRQKFAYLPEVIGDSIFAIIAEELGFFIAAFVVILFLLIAWRGIRIAKNFDEPYGRLVALGIVIWFLSQSFFNIGAMVGVLPITGIPLPFVSFGGTALVSALAAAGILVNISRQARL